ncbi:MAG: zinc ribbon domain-containing protein [Candidatus Bathyarchaeota archaeon]|nr:zinc ribbon domain-containing protein [Candidatus Bathyarchaeota archaeon]
MAQEEISILFLLPLLLLCCLLPLLFRGGSPRPAEAMREVDVWTTPQKIEDVFDEISKMVENWKAEVQAKPKKSRLSFLGGREKDKRFEVVQSIPPRLLRIFDKGEGETVFELTEIDGGGTSIRVSYHPFARPRIQTFKAKFPAKILTVWQSCSSCGKPILPDFIVCPYCSQKLKGG